MKLQHLRQVQILTPPPHPLFEVGLSVKFCTRLFVVVFSFWLFSKFLNGTLTGSPSSQMQKPLLGVAERSECVLDPDISLLTSLPSKVVGTQSHFEWQTSGLNLGQRPEGARRPEVRVMECGRSWKDKRLCVFNIQMILLQT